MYSSLPIIVTIIASILSLMATIIACTWVIRGMFAKLEAEMSAHREVMLAMNRRIERLESKIP